MIPMLQTLNVEKEELLRRAAELEAPLPAPPSENPAPACNLTPIINAADQLGLSADNMRKFVHFAQQEWGRLAQSLRNAAKAYEETDENAGKAINNETPVSPVTPLRVGNHQDPAVLTDTPVVTGMSEDDMDKVYADVRQRMALVEGGDQGASLLRFADAWENYQRVLLQLRSRFDPFEHWDSATSIQVEQNFDAYRTWLESMANLCLQMVAQARTLVSAHQWARGEHIECHLLEGAGSMLYTSVSFGQLEDEMVQDFAVNPRIVQEFLKLHADLLQKSDAVIADYQQRAGLPLPPVTPSRPPVPYNIDPDGPNNPVDPNIPNLPDPTDLPSGMPAGMPSLPSMPPHSQPTEAVQGSPGLPAEAVKDLKKSPGLPTGAGVKPVSLGGRIPAALLQPSVDPEAPSRPTAAPGIAGLGRTIPAASAARGGGGMGIPMGAPGAQGQHAGKGKRSQQQDNALYTEDRSWTEGVIGIVHALRRA
jgi:hypothetical protein